MRGRWLWGLLALVLLVGESVGFYVLARTYSRGALVGLGGAALVWGVLVLWRATRSVSRSGDIPVACRCGSRLGGAVPWLLRAGVVAVCLMWTGFHERLAPEHVAEDRSSLNRLVLWQGGAELVAASPLRGWGWGESGAAFMHWTQPLERREGYLSMVNSYLTVAVEAGLPVFTLLLAVLLLPLGLTVFAINRRANSHGGHRGPPSTGNAFLLEGGAPSPPHVLDYLRLAVAAAWAAWLGCLFFSNLWIIRPLWIAPGVAALAALFLCGRGLRVWRRGVLWALAGAAGASAALWVAGFVWAERQPLVLKRAADGSVLLRKPFSARGGEAGAEVARGEVWVVPDVAVFGESYGQELRRWCLADSGPARLRVYRQLGGLPSPVGPQVTGLLLCGAAAAQAGDLAGLDQKTQVWLLHPTSAPPQGRGPSWASGSRVLLPGIDITGEAAGWWGWAAEAEPPIPVQLSHGLAVDVRPCWPELGLDLGK